MPAPTGVPDDGGSLRPGRVRAAILVVGGALRFYLFYTSSGAHPYAYYVRQHPAHVPQAGLLPRVVFPPAGELASRHLVPEAAALERAARGSHRLFVVLNNETLADLPASFMRSYVKVDERSFGGLAPLAAVVVVGFDRRPAIEPGDPSGRDGHTSS